MEAHLEADPLMPAPDIAKHRANRKRRAWIVLLLLAALVFVPPFFTVNRLKKRLQTITSNAVGRPVDMGEIYIRVLPVPSFYIERFVIHDDPAISAEPFLQASSVTARLRLLSLWRGRLEISRLSFTEPSLNLVRNTEGRWNIASLLQRGSQAATAPTGKTQAQPAPRFPYIEAKDGRINFKFGNEKKPYALTEAEFSFWLESDNQWNMRLETRPTRTDQNLRDTGVLRAEGLVDRLPGMALEQTPFQFQISLEKSQLGQLSALLFGRDLDWRGNLELNATLQGTFEKLHVTSSADVLDLRRHNILSGEPVRVSVSCSGDLVRLDQPADMDSFRSQRALRGLDCAMPIAPGKISLNGMFGLGTGAAHKFSLRAADVPAAGIAALVRRVKLNMAEDFTASGVLNADLQLDTFTGAAQRSSGSGAINGLLLSSARLDESLAVGDVRFSYGATAPARTKLERKTPVSALINRHAPPELVFSPIAVPLGGVKPVSVLAKLTGSSFELGLIGDADISHLQTSGRMLGLTRSTASVSGTAVLGLAWTSDLLTMSPAELTGTVTLHNAKANVSDVAAPIQIAAANLRFSPKEIVVDKLSVSLEGTRLAADGTVTIPRTCDNYPCPITFDLRATELSFDDMNRVLNPGIKNIDWLAIPRRVIGGEDKKPRNLLAELTATGKITANRIIMKQLMANKAAAKVAVRDGKWQLTSVTGEVLGGKHTGSWTADFIGAAPSYSGTGTVAGLSLTQVNALLHDNSLAGTANVKYELKLAGADAAGLRQSAQGTLDVLWKNGWLRHVPVNGKPLQFVQWAVRAQVKDSVVTFSENKMKAFGDIYQASGQMNFSRELEFNLRGNRNEIAVKGMLTQPVVAVGQYAKQPTDRGKPIHAQSTKQ